MLYTCTQASGEKSLGMQCCRQQPEPQLHGLGHLLLCMCYVRAPRMHAPKHGGQQEGPSFQTCYGLVLLLCRAGCCIHSGPQVLDHCPRVCCPKDGAACHNGIGPCLCCLLDGVGRQAAIHLQPAVGAGRIAVWGVS